VKDIEERDSDKCAAMDKCHKIRNEKAEAGMRK
jgi:hypothetical protein